MNQDLSISVVIPYYQRRDLISETIMSVDRQTRPPLEILVVDDASRDGLTYGELAALTNIPLRLIILERNQGGAAARNAGIQAATGSFIAFIDSDDLWEPPHLQTVLDECARSGERTVVSARCRVLGRRPRNVGTARSNTTSDMLEYVLQGNLSFQTSSLMARTELLREVLFDPRLRRHQDWDLMARMLRSGVQLVQISQQTVIYRPPSGTLNLSRTRSAYPSLRFLAKHREIMNRSTQSKFIVEEILQRKQRNMTNYANILGLTIRMRQPFRSAIRAGKYIFWKK